MRIDELLYRSGYKARGLQKKLIASKQVWVDGCIVLSTKQNVDAQIQQITVQGKLISDTSQVYYMLNKPSGIVTAVTDAQHTTVIELLKEEDQVPGLYPIGRLDRDTQGLVLITNNGPLGFRMLHPQYHVEKQYLVTVNDCLTLEDCIAFEKGIRFLDGTICQPAQLDILSISPTESSAVVTIAEGKFHQIKKMFLSVGKKVIALKRIRFGELQLDETLEAGEYRTLNQAELQIIKTYLL